MSIIHQRLVGIFNEWAERYAKDPNEFGSILDDNGNAVSDYGECCARYFCQIAKEMDQAGQLPRHGAPIQQWMM